MSEINILLKWLEIKKIYSSDFPSSLTNLKLNIDKSSLLKRMLEGKDPLPEPPPKSYSYPWYSLIETGHSFIDHNEFFFPETWQKEFYEYDFIMIKQNPWEILSCENDKYRLIYYYQHLGQDVRSLNDWSFSKKEENNNEIWELKKL